MTHRARDATMMMKRVPSLGDLATPKTTLATKATVVASASTMLAATASIVSAAHTSAESVESLVGAVASMVGAAATIATAFDQPQSDLVTLEYGAETGVRYNGVLIGVYMEQAGVSRLDVRVTGRLGAQQLHLAECKWDAPGEPGVFLNGVGVQDSCAAMDLRVVGKGHLF